MTGIHTATSEDMPRAIAAIVTAFIADPPARFAWPFYLRYGFEVIGEIQIGAAPVVTPMVRKPQGRPAGPTNPNG